MTAHRLQRLLALAGVALVLGWRAPARFATASAAPQPPGIAFDSIFVDPPRFSPNDDGRSDTQRIAMYLDRAVVDLRVRVLRADRSDTLGKIFERATAPRGRTAFTWTGIVGSAPLAEGEYQLDFSATAASPDSFDFHNERPIAIDLTVPQVAITSIVPAIYTPTVPLTPAELRVSVNVSRSILGDQLVIVAKRKTQEFPMRLLGTFIGSGNYTAICDSCAKASFPDTTYIVEARASDTAANADTTRSTFDKDIRGPRTHLVHPALDPGASTVHVLAQRADSIVGSFTDRHGLDSLLVRGMRVVAAGGPTTWIDLHRMNTVPDTLYPTSFLFQKQLSGVMANEGRYDVALFSIDRYGVRDSFKLDYTIDRTAPAKPIFSPRPDPISKVEHISVVVRVDSAGTARVVRTGGSTPPQSLTAGRPTVLFESVGLSPGANLLSFQAFDATGNSSPPETTTVVYETTQGIAVPERFRPGNSIQLHAGSAPANGAEVRIYATDGSLVRVFSSNQSQMVYVFPWDLTTTDGRKVKNGAYLLHSIVHAADGSDVRTRKLIAVLE